MQVTFGEEGSGLSKGRAPRVLPEGNIGDWAPRRLRLVLRRRLREAESVDGGSRWPGLSIDLDESFIEELVINGEELSLHGETQREIERDECVVCEQRCRCSD